MIGFDMAAGSKVASGEQARETDEQITIKEDESRMSQLAIATLWRSQAEVFYVWLRCRYVESEGTPWPCLAVVPAVKNDCVPQGTAGHPRSGCFSRLMTTSFADLAATACHKYWVDYKVQAECSLSLVTYNSIGRAASRI